MRSPLLLLTLGAIMAMCLAEAPQDKARYKMLHMKKMVLTQIARIQNTDQPEEVKKAEIQGVYERFKKALHADAKATSLLPGQTRMDKQLRAAAEKEKELKEEAAHEGPGKASEETASSMKPFGKHPGHGMGMKRKHKGASLRRLAEDAATDGQKPGRRRRSTDSAKQVRTSFARAT